MHYYLDGYNLLFRALHAGDDLQQQREQLIESVTSKAALQNLQLTIVFDAAYQKGESSRSHKRDVEIVYTAHGEIADDYIFHAVRREPHPRNVTVITSDQRLAWRIRRTGAHAQSVESFLKTLRRSPKTAKPKGRVLPAVSTPTPPKSKRDVSNSDTSSPSPLPQSDSKAIENIDYYLQVFEERFRELEKDKKSKRPKK